MTTPPPDSPAVPVRERIATPPSGSVLYDEVLPVTAIRLCFPALSRRQEGQQVAYFDGPGGTQVPREVVEAMTSYLYHHNANTHWLYPTSEETDAAILNARLAFADFLNATPGEIAFGQNMTTLLFHLSRALGRRWESGDEVVVTEIDHHANVAPWRALEKERGITVRVVRMIPETGQLDWRDLERALTRRTRLLAINAASNAIGTITDVTAACRLAREVGALSVVDAVHYAPHVLTDVRRIGCDFLLCSAYKFYGPHVGVLFARRELVENLDVPKLIPAPDEPPEKLETGTLNHEGIVGAAAAVNFLAAIGSGRTRRAQLERAFAELHRRGGTLVARLHAGLSSIRGVRIHGPAADAPRTPTIAFSVEGMHSDDVVRALVQRALYLSNGDFYATTVIERLGRAADGVVRAGCACYTTSNEVDRLIEAVEEVVARRP